MQTPGTQLGHWLFEDALYLLICFVPSKNPGSKPHMLTYIKFAKVALGKRNTVHNGGNDSHKRQSQL